VLDVRGFHIDPALPQTGTFTPTLAITAIQIRRIGQVFIGNVGAAIGALIQKGIYLDDRFHESCHNRGIHLRFWTPIIGLAGVDADRARQWLFARSVQESVGSPLMRRRPGGSHSRLRRVHEPVMVRPISAAKALQETLQLCAAAAPFVAPLPSVTQPLQAA
jgi:hypothetical protein